MQQPTGYRAFIPNPLPPNPAIAISPDMQVLLSQAGILHEITGQSRNRKFVYQSYINLFRDDAEEAETEA